MFQVYILQSLKDLRTYTGHAKNVHDRLRDHNAGKVHATRARRPFTQVLIETFETLAEAKHRELYWKSGAGRRKLKKYFKEGFPPIPAPTRRRRGEEDGRGSPK